jgi:hypothetical protein
VTVEHDGALGCYLQWGAMVDGAGLRIWDVAPANVAEVLRRNPRVDFKRQLVAMMRAEAAAVTCRQGRVHSEEMAVRPPL